MTFLTLRLLLQWCSRNESEWGEEHPKKDSGVNQKYWIQQKRDLKTL